MSQAAERIANSAQPSCLSLLTNRRIVSEFNAENSSLLLIPTTLADTPCAPQRRNHTRRGKEQRWLGTIVTGQMRHHACLSLVEGSNQLRLAGAVFLRTNMREARGEKARGG